MRKFIVALSLLIVSPLVAQATAPESYIREMKTKGSYNLIDGSSFGAAVALRTVTVPISGLASVKQIVKVVDANSSVTTMTVTCSVSIDGTNYGQITSRSVTSGASTVNRMADTITIGGSSVWPLTYDVWGFNVLKCVYASASGTPTNVDKLYVQWQGVVGK